ncbi:hypothetical protein [Mycetocola spongiae]|uniref:hypothetical protein n=1 Tax=Mycetocola spongiae TaxID=2859226 RepID=UPI001CF5278A|nr:hypothetical protein [Mycetocola spongiae]UCR88491.1 hypothetical protein KXZ72_11035 [Mycetocola spongiae]
MSSKRSGIFLGVFSVLLGAVLPVIILGLVLIGGLGTLYWFPVVFMIFPANILLAAMVLTAAVLGFLALRHRGAGRKWGIVGLYLVLLQLIGFTSLMISIYLTEH